MFLVIPIAMVTARLSNLIPQFRYQAFLRLLPVMAIRWFITMGRLAGVRPSFNTEDALEQFKVGAVKDLLEDRVTRGVLVANSQWNVLWARYVQALKLGRPHPGFMRGMGNAEAYYTERLKEMGEIVPGPVLDVMPRVQGPDGWNVILGDVLANTYTDAVWGGLVQGLEKLRDLRVNLTNLLRAGPHEMSPEMRRTGLAIGLAEIEWSNNVGPSFGDLSTFESMYRLSFGGPMLSAFLEAGRFMGNEVPKLASWQILSMTAQNPGVPIERVLGVP